jgi:rfaE bifunctional protein kinase chain/domain/rfaE bifunctional protein nucleotidyltransferase chain/domain
MTPPAPGAPAHPSKILPHSELLARRAAARAGGRRVVHCHGCFDIVHPGHIRHLRYAKQLGDVLLVTLTGDEEVRKGTGRPLIPEELRAENLAALDCVDWVYVEQRPTAAELLAEVKPDVYVKGREYEFNKDPRFQAERAAVEGGGGRVVFTSGDVVFSSTALIAALEQSVDPFQARLSQLMDHPDLQGPALFSLISSFRSKRVLVVGETILDTYVLCDRPEVAGESPVMTLRPVERRHYDGGAAVIARHLAALGARPVLVTPMPRDEQGDAVRRRLLADGVEVRPFVVDTPLTEKQRFLVGAQKVMKLDLLEPLVLDARQQDGFIDLVEEAARAQPGVHAAIIADFGQGLFSPALVGRACRVCRRSAPVLTGDVSGRRSNLRAMQGMDLLCPSESELREAFGAFDRGLPTVTWQLLEETRSKAAVVTMGPEGLIAFDPLPGAERLEERSFASRLRAQHVPALSPFAIDPLGCGDSLISAATLALAGGGSLLAAAFLGSAAAAVEAQRLGNIPISATDLRQSIVRMQSAHMAFAPAEVVNSRSVQPAALRAS